MNKETRQSLPSKVAAIGFIAVVLFGNFWLVGHLLGNQPGVVIAYGFWLGVLTSLAGGVMLVARTLIRPGTTPDA